eukprot:scaffold13454_cov114-Isochrysis_galbana.AAC.6
MARRRRTRRRPADRRAVQRAVPQTRCAAAVHRGRSARDARESEGGREPTATASMLVAEK